MTILIADQANHSTTSNKALSAGFFLAVGVTLWTTTLIAYRIYSTSNHIIQKHSKTRFTNVLEILVQSSAMYSVILLANALLTAIPENSSNIWTIGYISDIFGVMLHAITVSFQTDFYYLVVTEAFLGDRTLTDGLQSYPCIIF